MIEFVSSFLMFFFSCMPLLRTSVLVDWCLSYSIVPRPLSNLIPIFKYHIVACCCKFKHLSEMTRRLRLVVARRCALRESGGWRAFRLVQCLSQFLWCRGLAKTKCGVPVYVLPAKAESRGRVGGSVRGRSGQVWIRLNLLGCWSTACRDDRVPMNLKGY